MLKESVFRKFIIILTLFTILIVFFTTYRYYKKLPELKAETDVKQQVTKEQKNVPIKPFEAFSMKKEDLLIKFGEGKEGLADTYENMYIDYNQNWFSINVDSRYYYGDYGRVYQIMLSYPMTKAKEVYNNMKRDLGEPLYDGIYGNIKEDEETQVERVTYWFKDSVRYTLANYEDEDLCMVTMNLQYYPNVEEYDMGDRPTEIQRINDVKIGNSTVKGNLILIGDKPEYTSIFYERLFIIFGTEQKTYMGTFSDEYDGGFYPEMKVLDFDQDGENEIIVKADNEYTTFYTVLKYESGQFSVVYAGEENPIGKDIEKLEEDKPEEIIINEPLDEGNVKEDNKDTEHVDE